MATATHPAHGQGHLADNLEKQLNEIMVQMGRIFKAPSQNPERADQIVVNAKKKMSEATDSFHSTLDEMEIEITRAKSVFLRDLHKIQEKQKAIAPAPAPAPDPAPAPAPAPVRAQPPAPMAIDLDPPKAGQASAPVAPMMASSSPSLQNRPNPKAPESKPVAPFPDMGIGTSAPAPPAAVPFHPVKTSEAKRPSPKPANKPGPPSGRPASKKSPLVTRQALKPPASVPPPPPAPAVAQVAPPATKEPAPNGQNHHNPFTNATFTLDPTNSDIQTQPGSHDVPTDPAGLDNTAALDGLGLPEGSASATNTEPPSANTGNDSSSGNADDLDHFFDLGSNSHANFDENFNDIGEFMNNDFTFDTFE